MFLKNYFGNIQLDIFLKLILIKIQAQLHVPYILIHNQCIAFDRKFAVIKENTNTATLVVYDGNIYRMNCRALLPDLSHYQLPVNSI